MFPLCILFRKKFGANVGFSSLFGTNAGRRQNFLRLLLSFQRLLKLSLCHQIRFGPLHRCVRGVEEGAEVWVHSAHYTHCGTHNTHLFETAIAVVSFVSRPDSSVT
jgi:hypothetical protein